MILPSRRSVGCCAPDLPRDTADSCAFACLCSRVVPVRLMPELSANCWLLGKLNQEGYKGVISFVSFVVPALLSRGYNAEAHVGSVRRVGQKANRDKVDAGFGVGADIFEAIAARALVGDAATRFSLFLL